VLGIARRSGVPSAAGSRDSVQRETPSPSIADTPAKTGCVGATRSAPDNVTVTSASWFMISPNGVRNGWSELGALSQNVPQFASLTNNAPPPPWTYAVTLATSLAPYVALFDAKNTTL